MPKWRKLGLLFSQENYIDRHPKLISHAANPLPVHIAGDIYRVFFSGRDEDNRSSVGAVDIDISSKSIVKNFKSPFFTYGDDNSYYSHGVSIGCCYMVANKQYMLFMGWQVQNGQHWRGDIGCLSVEQNHTLKCTNNAPLIGMDDIDKISISYPWVLVDKSGVYHMWYGSTLSWDAGNDEMTHVINHAYSFDGNSWKKDGLAIPYILGQYQAFSRPTVIDIDGKLHMWFSYRAGNGDKYKIGYASSTDWKKWIVDIESSGISVSVDGWDSEMIEYPYVWKHNNDIYMLYNGNGYGKTGFGLAVLESE